MRPETWTYRFKRRGFARALGFSGITLSCLIAGHMVFGFEYNTRRNQRSTNMGAKIFGDNSFANKRAALVYNPLPPAHT